jgi:NADPH:quinone reductase-like Zn-dependent oxidoreductase
MRAAITPSYGPAHVLQTRDVPTPTVGPRDVLVEVHASPVTAGDLRLRAADFPSITAWPGRLLLGVRRPRRAVQGTMFAGRVVAVGASVTRYAVGDDVFGSVMHGAYAEYLSMPEAGALARMPANLSYDEAAAVPYGAVTALRFLRDVAAVAPSEQLLVLGAAGGVGRFAVQLAKHLGAEVTAVCSRRGFELVRSLGADHLVDHETEDFTKSGRRYDVIFDTADATTFARCRPALTPTGRYLTLYISVGVLLQVAVTSLRGGPKARFAVVAGSHDDLEQVRELVARGVVRPVIARRFPLEDIAAAHAEAEAARPLGAVLVTVRAPAALRTAAPAPGSRSQTAAPSAAR